MGLKGFGFFVKWLLVSWMSSQVEFPDQIRHMCQQTQSSMKVRQSGQEESRAGFFFFVRTADLNSHQTAVLMLIPFMPSNKKQELTHMSQLTNETAAFWNNTLRPFKNIPWKTSFFSNINHIIVTSQKVCFTKGCLPDPSSLNYIKLFLWSGVILAHQNYSFISHKSQKYLGSLTKIQYLHCCCTQSYFQNSLKNSGFSNILSHFFRLY